MTRFADALTSMLHPGMALPPALIQTFDWIEAQGWTISRGDAPQDQGLHIYPPELVVDPATSHAAFGGSPYGFSDHWETPDPAVDARVADIAETAGDGGRAALWLDDTGKQWFVHLGHDTLGTITDDPVVFLHFLAMGYPEPGALSRTDITPLQAAQDYHGTDDLPPEDQPIAPQALQAFLAENFPRPAAQTARDLGIADFSAYDDADSTDPFVRWVAEVTPPPPKRNWRIFRKSCAPSKGSICATTTALTRSCKRSAAYSQKRNATNR
ncbi:hypothetical protein KDD17_14320 [Sulfitobacter albidus]|uniref:SMI1/KNR4 family protein n=1 Tax=Sulfitobacter albidus TaxID=2829501 RepID=A0A975PLT9_9RHOB|nr:hypothetical protein [Sulfitobacter albidus]QUJ76083.1 hypothetical protein KDD17_14320 [Sulfitobacter albidus]